MEAKLANGGTVDIAEYCTLSSTATRISSRIGIERRATNVTPTLREYLANRETIDAEPAS
jgi:hypothetical protein